MHRSRLVILAVVAIGIAVVAATQTCRERPPAAETPALATAPAPTGVAPRATHDAIDLRERDRLREDEPPAPASLPAVPAAAGEAEAAPPPEREAPDPDEPPPAAEPIPASPTVEAAMAGARAAAETAVAKVHGTLRAECWDGIDRGGIAQAKLAFSLGFDAEGKVVASAVQQARDTYIDGLDRCLAPFAHAIAVPAPGEPVSVEVELTLP
jgi:hypothetical protein